MRGVLAAGELNLIYKLVFDPDLRLYAVRIHNDIALVFSQDCVCLMPQQALMKNFTALAASKTERDLCFVVGPNSRCLEFASLINFMYAFNASLNTYCHNFTSICNSSTHFEVF